MKAVYIFAGFVIVVLCGYFAFKIGNMLVNGMQKRIARINQDRQKRKSINRGF